MAVNRPCLTTGKVAADLSKTQCNYWSILAIARTSRGQISAWPSIAIKTSTQTVDGQTNSQESRFILWSFSFTGYCQLLGRCWWSVSYLAPGKLAAPLVLLRPMQRGHRCLDLLSRFASNIRWISVEDSRTLLPSKVQSCINRCAREARLQFFFFFLGGGQALTYFDYGHFCPPQNIY